ncbi:MAG: hypothetical protein ABII64_00525 [Elusimicrobiota bacterium]
MKINEKKKTILWSAAIFAIIVLGLSGWKYIPGIWNHNRYPVLVSNTEKRQLTKDEYNAIKNRRGSPTVNVAVPKTPSVLPKDVRNNIDTINTVQRINAMNKSNRR